MLIIALVMFFVSGIAGLIYQVTWQRMLVIFSGTDIHAATIVVAAFMAGLGCGSLGGGHVADRLTPRASILLFAAAELAIAAYGWFSPTILYTELYGRLGQVNIGLAATAIVLAAALALPTFLMGTSLPLLARAVSGDIHRVGSRVGALYGVNTLGAAAGALGTTLLLLPRAGMVGSVRAAAILNLASAAAAVVLALAARNRPLADAPTGQMPASEAAPAITRLPFAAWSAVFAGSGFIALSLEIVWFRVMGVALKSTSFTFGILLSIYLAGIGVGAAAGSAWAARFRRPATGFFMLQAASGLYAALSLTLLVAGGEASWWPPLTAYFASAESIDVRSAVVHISNGALAGDGLVRDFLGLYLLLPAALIGPPTLMMGFGFPLLQRAVHTDLAHVGRHVGALLAANIAGSTLGAFITGWVLLDRLGTSATLKLLFLLSAVFGLMALVEAGGLRASRRRRPIYAAAAVISAAAVIVTIPDRQRLWASLHGTTPANVIVAEDGTGVSVLKAQAMNFRHVDVYVGGASQSWVPYGNIHTVLGALPAFTHPHPRTAAIVGLGSGDTLFGLAGRPELERITSIEIVAPQLTTLQRLLTIYNHAGLRGITVDPRIRHTVGDGRLYLRRAPDKYDIIEADALRPSSAYSGNLYSDAYFRLLRDKLNPRGLAVTWAPTPRVARTFASVFPFVWRHQEVLMGSSAPLEVNRAAILERLRGPLARDYFVSAGVDIEALLRPYITGPFWSDGQTPMTGTPTDINTDLYPRDEFQLQ